jgi:hypothetical protein
MYSCHRLIYFAISLHRSLAVDYVAADLLLVLLLIAVDLSRCVKG